MGAGLMLVCGSLLVVGVPWRPMRTWRASLYLAALTALTTQGVGAQGERPPTLSSGQILFVANGLGASIQAFRVGVDGQMTEVSGSPFPAPPNVNLIRVTPDGQTLIASASEGPSAPTSTLAAYHITNAGALVDTGSEVTLSGSARQFAFARRDGQTFVYVPTAALPGGDRIHGFALIDQGPATALLEASLARKKSRPGPLTPAEEGRMMVERPFFRREAAFMIDQRRSSPPESPASNRSAQDPQKPGQPVRPGPPVEAEDPVEKAEGPKPPAHYTATHEPGDTDDRPDDTGRQQGDKGAL